MAASISAARSVALRAFNCQIVTGLFAARACVGSTIPAMAHLRPMTVIGNRQLVAIRLRRANLHPGFI
jgi:hypothetical protein